ncbi:sulfite exporter TauE/SafE family protein [soil metagenome]
MVGVEFIAYIVAVLIGISLGLIGAGGAIVAVPLFVYLLQIPPTRASGYALFVVAVSSIYAVIQHHLARRIDWRAVIAFGMSTTISVFLVRAFVMPFLPATFTLGPISVERDHALMIAFAGVLFAAAIGMLRSTEERSTDTPPHVMRLTLFGVVIGVISGFLGVGGGFLMTPALVLWGRLDMKRAVATSLFLICVNSAVGVAADMRAGLDYDWPFVLTFTGLTTVGIIIGTVLGKRVHATHLRKGFGWFVLLIGTGVLLRELFF